MKLGYLIILNMVCGSMVSFATTPTVIFDNGHTQSLVPYFKAIKVQSPTQPNSSPTAMPVEGLANERQQLLSRSLPVRTPELTPGHFTPKTIAIPYLERPVFMVGADRLSLQWLEQHHKRLNALQAVGLVVNVETAQQLAQLKQSVAPLELYALPGTSFAKQFTLTHYPALISASRIEQ